MAGLCANVELPHTRYERNVAFELGGNPVMIVICGGKIVARAWRSGTSNRGNAQRSRIALCPSPYHPPRAMALAFPHNRISASDADAAYAAAQKVVETHRRLSAFLRHGQTLAQIDAFVARTLDDLSCKSCFLGYRVPKSPPFPSHACLSVNECVVHGTAAYYLPPLKAGDVLKIDIGVTFRGWIGDAAWTYVFGQPSEQVRRLMECGKETLKRGIATLRPGNTYMAWARAVQTCVEEEFKFHLVRGLGGHGYGRKLHAPPFVSNVVPSQPGEWQEGNQPIEAGTLLAVEPMIGVGTGRIRQKRGEWPIFIEDGSLSVHYEHDVLVTDSGPRVLTEGLESLPDVIG